MRSSREEQEISQCVMQILQKQRKFLDGKQKKVWTRCAQIHGDGSHRILTDMRHK